MKENKATENTTEQLPHSDVMKQKALEMTNEVKKQEAELEAAFKYFSETNIGNDQFSQENDRDTKFKEYGDKAQESLNILRERKEGEDQLDPSIVAEKIKEMIKQMRGIVLRIESGGYLFSNSYEKYPEAKEFAKTLKEKILQFETIYSPMATRLFARKQFERMTNDASYSGDKVIGGFHVASPDNKDGKGTAISTLSNYDVGYFKKPEELIKNGKEWVAKQEKVIIPEDQVERKKRAEVEITAAKEYLDEFEKLANLK